MDHGLQCSKSLGGYGGTGGTGPSGAELTTAARGGPQRAAVRTERTWPPRPPAPGSAEAPGEEGSAALPEEGAAAAPRVPAASLGRCLPRRRIGRRRLRGRGLGAERRQWPPGPRRGALTAHREFRVV